MTKTFVSVWVWNYIHLYYTCIVYVLVAIIAFSFAPKISLLNSLLVTTNSTDIPVVLKPFSYSSLTLTVTCWKTWQKLLKEIFTCWKMLVLRIIISRFNALQNRNNNVSSLTHTYTYVYTQHSPFRKMIWSYYFYHFSAHVIITSMNLRFFVIIYLTIIAYYYVFIIWITLQILYADLRLNWKTDLINWQLS